MAEGLQNEEHNDEHHRIARSIKTGISPENWCTICSFAIKRQDRGIKCGKSHTCQNYCHHSCLQGLTQYFCDDTASLRASLGISAPIEFLPQDQPTTQEDQDLLDSEREEELLRLPTGQLVALVKERDREIKTLRSELEKKKALLSYFNTVDLATKRDAVATVLQFIDNIQAVKTSTDSLEVTSAASTARADLIDDEWQKKINTYSQGGVEAKAWWTSDKPRPLTSCLIESPVPTTATRPEQRNPASLHRNAPSQRNAAQQRNTANTQQNSEPSQQHRRPSLQSYTANTQQSSVPPQQHRRPSQQQQQHHSSSQRPPSRPQRSRQVRRNIGSGTNIGTGTNQHQAPGRQVSFCQHCKTKGHTENDCRKKQHCNFCKRHGHLEQDCRTKVSEERQERLMRTLSAEQAQNNALLFQSIQRQLNFHPYQSPGHLPHSGWLGYNARSQQNQGPLVHPLV